MAEETIVILAIFIILQILDAGTTYKVFQLLNPKEKNKLMAWWIEKIGLLPALISFKIAMTGLIAFALWYAPVWQVQSVAGLVCAAYLWAVIGNWRQL